MKRTLDFFNVSSLLEEISEKEASMLKGGDSDIDYEVDLDEVEVIAPVDDDWPDIDPDPDDDFDPYDPSDDYDPTQDDGWDNDSDGGSTDPNTSGDSDDSWVRDANGKIKYEVVQGKKTTFDFVRDNLKEGFDKVKLELQEVKIKTKDGRDIIAYKVVGAYNESGKPISEILDRYKSNCYGYAFAGGELWFADPYDNELRDPNFNEMKGLEDLLKSNDLFSQVSDKSEADAVAIWDSNGMLYHAAQYDAATGTYNDKSDHSNFESFSNEADFLEARFLTNNPEDFTVVYYKQN